MLQIGDTFQDGGAVFKVKKFGADGALIGSVTWYAGASTPENYLLCDGSAVSRTNYADLFAVIGTTYGTGDGSTTFNLPLLTDSRFIEGSNTPGIQHEAGLPNIDGTVYTSAEYDTANRLQEPTPLWKIERWPGPRSTITTTGNALAITFDASKANATYGASNTVQPTSLTLRPLIKYI